MVLQIAVHKVFSHLTRGLGHFADNSSILSKQPTTVHPRWLATVLQTVLSFILRSAISETSFCLGSKGC